ncbi:MAG: GGDEF domain-containing protein, partial [Motiliproteus sp.]
MYGKDFPIEAAVSEVTVSFERCFTALLQNVSVRESARRELLEKSTLTQLLHTISSVSNEAIEPAPAMQIAIAEICRFKDWPIGHVYYPDAENPELLLPSDIWYLSKPTLFAKFKQSTSQTLLRIGEGLPGRVLQSQHSCWIKDLKDDDNFIRPFQFDDFCLKAAFAVPVVVEKRVVAVMEFFSETSEQPDENLLCIFDDIGKQLGMVYNRKNLLDRISFLASHDDLTGLPSRNVVKDRIAQAIRSAKRKNSKVAVIFADLDNFKEINDVYGHSCGDIVLKTVASRLRKNIREADTVARFGGDEFIIVLADVHDSKSATTVCNKVIAAMSPPIDHEGNQHCIGISLGIALFPDHGVTDTEILSSADKAMYKAKKSGKNNYQQASPPEPQGNPTENK